MITIRLDLQNNTITGYSSIEYHGMVRRRAESLKRFRFQYFRENNINLER